MTPGTFLRSHVMRLLASEGYAGLVQRRARLARRLRGASPAVHYFHQVDDPYSHLAVQKLDALRAAYDLPFQVHLASAPSREFQGSADHFGSWARRDAAAIARGYGTHLAIAKEPTPDRIAAANTLLAPRTGAADFAVTAIEVGEAFWAGRLDPVEGDAGEAATAAGDALRRKLGHYLGGMFHFEGEWFWGVDRIRHLERRLIAAGYGSEPLRVPEPTPADTTGLQAGHVVLEYFPSLRSPYTAVGHPRFLELAGRSGVTVRLRPVMPMMMRGIPAPQAKQRYIITDAAREARARGVPFGRIVDPFGEPVHRAFALYAAAETRGGGMAFVTSYLQAAWADGMDITRRRGLQQVVERAGLDLDELERDAGAHHWQSALEGNLQEMLEAGLWGVPSFRVSGGNDPNPFACWGQDRLWRVENEIADRAR